MPATADPPDQDRQMRSRFILTMLLLPLGPIGAIAQVRASELATVSQTVDGTTLTIEYSRPKARGRTTSSGELDTM